MASTEAGGYRERLLAGAVSCLQDKGYARTTARDLVAASGTNLASIGYHFGGKEALLNEAIAEFFEQWTARVERSLFGSELGTPRDLLQRALEQLVDVFGEMRPQLVLCVESFPAAVREPLLRAKLADAYARARVAGTDMLRRAAERLETELPVEPAALVSVVIAISDGLMLQWLLDPEATPDARQVVDVLAALGAFVA